VGVLRAGLAAVPPDTKVFWERTLTNLKRARDRVARPYNALRSEAVFRFGDLVLVKFHPRSSKALKRSAKIDNKWSTLITDCNNSQLKRYFTGD
jgi:hypothetical protein